MIRPKINSAVAAGSNITVSDIEVDWYEWIHFVIEAHRRVRLCEAHNRYQLISKFIERDGEQPPGSHRNESFSIRI